MGWIPRSGASQGTDAHFDGFCTGEWMTAVSVFKVSAVSTIMYWAQGRHSLSRADEDEVKALAALMTYNVPWWAFHMAGPRGGILCDPRELSEEQRAAEPGPNRAIARIIGRNKTFPPDVNTNAKIMGWFVDEYSLLRGSYQQGVVTGKPIAIGGSQGRGGATGRGVMYVIREAAAAFGLELEGATVAVQGFGNVGSYAAQFLYDLGCKIIAVADVFGGVYCEDGIDPYLLKDHEMKTGSVKDFAGTTPISNEELLTMECDILIPAALGNQLTGENAGNVKAKWVVEAANGPTTPDADAILKEKGVLVIPDVLANAGGVTVSYFEWVQNNYNYYWSAEEVDQRLERIMAAFQAVYKAYMIGKGLT